MSMQVTKAGISDTIQDAGRYGYQHLGINPTGCMDLVAMQVANMLVGNTTKEAVVELCFPAGTYLFKSAAMIALSGADFGAKIKDLAIPINRTIVVPAGSELKFTKHIAGAYAYMAVHGGFNVSPWLDSVSTNVKAVAGGLHGRRLTKNDEIPLHTAPSNVDAITIYPWRADVSPFYSAHAGITCLPGNEFDWLDSASKKILLEESFSITNESDRMGYRLQGKALKRKETRELLSTAVVFGTIQLLPSGQLIILMADHQTTGGYPRIAQVISADRSKLAQRKTKDTLQFTTCTLELAQHVLQQQQQWLRQMEIACRFNVNTIIGNFIE